MQVNLSIEIKSRRCQTIVATSAGRKIMTFRTLFSLIATTMLIPIGLAETSDQAWRPDLVIQQASDELLAAIDGRRRELTNNPEMLNTIVSEILLPRFDTRYAARLILPRHWTSITSEQQQQFLDALYGSLIRRYAIGALRHHETRIHVTPVLLKLLKAGEDFVTVKTTVTMDNGTEVPVYYEMRWIKPHWKIYDVKIEGRSYVLYYRGIIGPQLKEKGIDTVIRDLDAS